MLPISISVQQTKPGMIVADDVYSPSGLLILSKNTVLNPRSISKMKLYNVKSLYVIIHDSVAAEEHKEEDEKRNPVRSSSEFKVFKRTLIHVADSLSSVMDTLLAHPGTRIDFSPLLSEMSQITAEVRGTLHLLELMHCMREYDDTVYVHSINVALVAQSIAARLKLSLAEQSDLTLACLLHDIGKLRIPKDILNKPAKLTDAEYALIKRHPQSGYELLKEARLPEHILLAVLLHHERHNGSGYPTGVTGDKMPLFSRILAIADVYDAMTARRSYRKEICAFDVIASFEADGYQKYDTTLLLPFLESIAQAYINAPVRLTNSLVGTIVMLNHHKLSRPIVNVDGQFYDLTKYPELSIAKVL